MMTVEVGVRGQRASVVSSHSVGPGDRTQVLRLGGRPLSLLNHLVGICSVIFRGTQTVVKLRDISSVLPTPPPRPQYTVYKGISGGG